MRLNEFEIECITKLARLHFGSGVQVYLFGSRTITLQKGGDIDLFISNKDDGHLNLRTKISFITDLIEEIGEQKIDVVFDKKDRRNSFFFRTIEQTKVQLC